MGIKGLTDRKVYGTEVGRLRKGTPKIGGRMGKNLDYFRFDTPDPALAAAFTETYGPEPRLLNVFLPFSEIGDNWQAWKEQHRGDGKLVKRCDGECIVKRLMNKEGTQYSNEKKPCECAAKGLTGNDACKPKGKLKLIVDGIGTLDYVVLVTTSAYDIANLDGALQELWMQRNNLQGIPCVLVRRQHPVEKWTSDRSRKIKSNEPLVFLKSSPEWGAFVMETRKRMAMGVSLPAMAPAPIVNGADLSTGEIVDEQPGVDPAHRRRHDMIGKIGDLLKLSRDIGTLVAEPSPDWAKGDEPSLVSLGTSLRASIVEALEGTWEQVRQIDPSGVSEEDANTLDNIKAISLSAADLRALSLVVFGAMDNLTEATGDGEDAEDVFGETEEAEEGNPQPE